MPSQPKASDDLLEYFKVKHFCEIALTQPPKDYNANVLGDRSLYRGDGKWALSILADWPPTNYSFTEIPPEQIRSALRFQSGPGRPLDQSFLGERVYTAPVHHEQRGEKKKRDKKEKKEKKKKEKREKEDRKRKRDDSSVTEVSQYTGSM